MIKATKIEFLWSESSIFQKRYGNMDHVVAVKTWDEANDFLRGIAHHEKNRLGYDKTAFRVTFEDGQTYEGRYDLHGRYDRQENPNGRFDLADHILAFLRFASGRHRPVWMAERDYRVVLNRTPELTTAAGEWLDKYEIGHPRPMLVEGSREASDGVFSVDKWQPNE